MGLDMPGWWRRPDVMPTHLLNTKLASFPEALGAANGPVVWGFQKFDIRDFNKPFTQIVGGRYHTVALKNDGTVVAWGSDYLSRGGATVPSGLSGVIAVAAGDFHTVALKNDGTVVAWGDNSSGQATVPAGLSPVSAIAASGSHTLALKTDGMVVAWGSNSYGQTTVPVGLSGVSAIAAGGYWPTGSDWGTCDCRWKGSYSGAQK